MTPKTKFLHQKQIAVFSLSGNQGKSTLVNTFLAPRCHELENVFYLEGINQIPFQISEPVGKTISSNHDFSKAIDGIYVAEALKKSTIIDFGSSDAENIRALVSQYGLADLIDSWIIPVRAGGKEISDCINSVQELLNLGVTPQKIRIFMNRVQMRDIGNVKNLFKPIFQLAEAVPGIGFAENMLVGELEVFRRLNSFQPPLTFSQILELKNLDVEIARAETAEDRAGIAALLSTQRLAKNANDYFDNCFKNIFSGEEFA